MYEVAGKSATTSGLLNVRSKFPALGISEKCPSEGSKERHLPAKQKIQKQSSHFVKQHAIFCKLLVEILLTDAAPAAWKAAYYGYMWHRNKTAEARRKPVLIDRFHLTHPGPAKPYLLSAMTEFLCAVGVVPTRVSPKSGCISALAGR
ncbi:TPA: hypothetical protein ACGZB6_004165, partial [Escherichia coli]